jgi:hypothetical protein
MAGTNPAMVIRVAASIEELKKNLKEGRDQIETTTAAMSKIAASLSGDKLIQQAHNVAAAVNQIGGASKLTGQEQDRVNSLITRALEKYQLLGREAPPGMRELADATKKVVVATESVPKSTAFFADLTSQVKATALGFISAQAVIGAAQTAFHMLTAFVGDSIDSFAAAEAAQKKLTTALQASGATAPGVIDQFNAMAAQFQRTTVYSDDLITEMQALLVQVGNVAPSQMNKALQASADLASGLGIDLQQATMLVAKAFAGGGDELGRLKAILGDAAISGRGMDGVLESIEKKFSGQAAGEIDTYAGHVKQLANAWDDVKEAVGRGIVQNPVVIAAMRQVTEETRRQTDAASESGDELERRLRVFGPLYLAYRQLADAAKAANTEASNLNRVIANAPQFDLASKRVAQFGRDLVNVSEYLQDEADKQKKAAEAVKQHAEAIAKLREELSGKGAIKAALDMLEALRTTIPIQKMTAEAQDKINKVMGEARDVFRAQGKEVPDAIWKVFEATFKLTDTIPLINRWRDSLAHSADGVLALKTISDKLAHETWPATIDGLDRIFIVQGKVIQQSKTLGERMQSSFGDVATVDHRRGSGRYQDHRGVQLERSGSAEKHR